MNVVEKYSHLNGLEYLLVHKPSLWFEIQEVMERSMLKIVKPKRQRKNEKGTNALWSRRDEQAI